MNEELKKLYDERLKIDHDQKAIVDTVEKEKRGFSPEEEETYNKMDERFNTLTDEIKTKEAELAKVTERRQTHESRKDMFKEVTKEAIKPDPSKKEDRKERVPLVASDEYRKAFAAFLCDGHRALEVYQELRALQADKDTIGGFLVAPEQFVTNLIKDKDRMVYMRQFATVYAVPTAASLGAPVLDNDPADPTWTAEIRTGVEDATMDFEKRALYPHPLAQRIKVSNKLLRVSRIGVEDLVRSRLAYKFGIVEENAFLNGHGGNQPLGVFVASADGINTGRDVTTGNTTSAVTADNLIETKYKLEAQYRTNCRWIMHRDWIKAVRKLKTGDGQYIWKAGIATDRPDTILDYPVHESEYAPSTASSGYYVAILGDFSFYWIADAMDMQVAVLTELYAETNQTGYIGRMETDGMPVHEKAFSRSKLA